MLNTAAKVLKWVAVVIGALIFLYLILLVPRYEKYRKSDVSYTLDLPPLTAYAQPNSYTIGDSLRLFLHSTEPYSGSVYRLGNSGFDEVQVFSGQANLQSGHYDIKYGHDWSLTHSIPTHKWRAGLYLINLRLKGDEMTRFSIPMMLRKPKVSGLMVVLPTNTWQAYNQYGGKSNYQDAVTPRDLRALFDLLEKSSPGLVPYNYLPAKRPIDHPFSHASIDQKIFELNGKVSSDFHLIDYLEDLGLDYDVISDAAFSTLGNEENLDLVIFDNHSEYWSYGAIGRLKNLLENGTSAVFLSGNNMYRGVETTDHGSLIVTEQQLPRSVLEPLLGTFYTESGYQTYGSFRVTAAESWVFDSTGVENGDTFGQGIISGLETDKLGPYSEGFTLLAIGTNSSGPAHMVIKEFSEGNYLFNSSSISSVRAIPKDTVWRQVILNLINKATK